MPFSLLIIKYLLNTYCAPRKISETWCGGGTYDVQGRFSPQMLILLRGTEEQRHKRQQDRQTHTHRKEARDKMLIWQYNQKTPKSGKAWPRWTDFITGGCSEGEGLEAWVELGETERHVWCTKQSRQEVQILQPWVTVPGLKKKKSHM